MKNLSWWAIKYFRITIAFWLAIAVAGIFAFNSLKYALFPDITFPVIVIRAESSLEQVVEVEQNLTIPIESSVKALPGLSDIESTIYPRQTIISLLFDTGTNITNAENDVNHVLERMSFPEDASWNIIAINLNESAVVSYAVISDRYSIPELTQIAQDKIIPVINSITGVQRVDLLGNTQENDNLIHFNGQNAIAIRIVKNEAENTLELVHKLAEKTQELQQQLTDIQLVVAETQAKYIKEATQATVDALGCAILLAIATIFVFLKNWKATLITAIAIPISLLGTFIVMAIAGFNLETLTLLALALVIGIIVDDAIVEVENIMRHVEAGETPRQAALLATKEIGLTVSISTLTIVAVFLPVALMGGTLGQFFLPFGFTLSAAVVISLLVARTLSPVLAVCFLENRENKAVDYQKHQQERKTARKGNNIANFYSYLLSWSLSNRKLVIAIALMISVMGVSLIPLIPQGFIPQLDRGEFNLVYTTALPNIKQQPTKDKQVEDSENINQLKDKKSSFSWLKKLAQSPEEILLRRTLRIGEKLEQILLDNPEVEHIYTIAGIRGEINKGKIYIKLKSNRTLSTEAVKTQIRDSLPELPQVIVSIEDIPFVDSGEHIAFKLALVGENLQSLEATATALKNQVELQLPQLVDVKITGEELPIETITRFNQQRVIYLTANLAQDTAIGDITPKVVAIAEPLLPPNVTIKLEGESSRSKRILGEFGLTIILSVGLMLVVLYLPFRRWLEPLVIGLSLPLAIIGAMLALLITQSDFGMISLIGLIFLLGLLDKNALLIMDYVNQLRKSGMTRTKAIIETGKIRLRPIIMTSSSTILGMLPIAWGWGAGSELRQPMAVAIIGGLLASSLLSLIVVPVLYTLLEDYWIKKKSS
ncbi:MAG: efflux RND transporter permease subunit [Xenococcus sp. MO_188.B8]|nr:efflux RND transporter permease subunit [Xenococcus sp. MO_188.B8]